MVALAVVLTPLNTYEPEYFVSRHLYTEALIRIRAHTHKVNLLLVGMREMEAP